MTGVRKSTPDVVFAQPVPPCAPYSALQNPFRPFCSERCKLIDLGAWAEERFQDSVQERHCQSWQQTRPNWASVNPA